MTTFNRPQQMATTLAALFKQAFSDFEVVVVDDGSDELSPAICKTLQLDDFPLRYIKLNRPESSVYRNPARPNNVGIRQALGDVVILQNAECLHIDPESVQKLSTAVTATNAVFAKVMARKQDGSPDVLYCGKENPRPYFFCGAIQKAWFEKLRGFDEDFVGYGFEDDDFASRLYREGVTFEFSEIEVWHQWHVSVGGTDMSETSKLCERKKQEGTIRNLGREWGACDTP